MTASQPTQGALIDGRYQLVDRLGSSARGESWRALDNRFGQRPVVVRFHRDADLEASAHEVSHDGRALLGVVVGYAAIAWLLVMGLSNAPSEFVYFQF